MSQKQNKILCRQILSLFLIKLVWNNYLYLNTPVRQLIFLRIIFWMMINFSRFRCDGLMPHDNNDEGNHPASNVYAVGIQYYPFAILIVYTTFSDAKIYVKFRNHSFHLTSPKWCLVFIIIVLFQAPLYIFARTNLQCNIKKKIKKKKRNEYKNSI